MSLQCKPKRQCTLHVARRCKLLLRFELATCIKKNYPLVLDMQDNIYLAVAIDVFELGRHGSLVGIVGKQGRAFINTGVGIITARQLDDKYLAMQVFKDKMGRVVSRVTMADDFIGLVHTWILVGGVKLLVCPPGT